MTRQEGKQWLVIGATVVSLLIAMVILASCGGSTSTRTSGAKAEPLSQDERMDWWRDARFGMFVHWGLYSVPAGTYKGERIKGLGEWIMNDAKIPVEEYEKFAPQFNPIGFKADEWVRLAKNAGMKYIVITSKHHDGFCLWDSKVSEWDIMDATPFKRDILKELSVACKKQGVKLCFYHSIMDWHHPDAQAPSYPNYNDGSKSNPNFDRYVDSYLKCIYLRDRIGQTFEGLITTVVDFGCFVQILDAAADGLLHIDNLRDDEYVKDDALQAWVGVRSKRRLQLGNHVRVIVTAVNPVEGLIDLDLAPIEVATKGGGTKR
jgi:predicted RNA-binding protein with RPS1 domain